MLIVFNKQAFLSKCLRRNKPARENGFTILELMIASTVFAVILLVVAAGVISFTNTYYKGIISSQTQTVARSIMSQISQSIEYNQTELQISGGGIQGICTDTTLYAYDIGQQLTDSAPNLRAHQAYHSLLTSNIAGAVKCDSNTLSAWASNYFNTNNQLPPGIRELVNQHMRLSVLDVSHLNGNLYTIEVKVIYGDDDLLTPGVPLGSNNTNWALESCAGRSGSQFCAVSDLTTAVDQRL